MALFKEFVFNEWLHETVSVFKSHKVKHCAFMEKNNLISLDGSVSISVPGSAFRFLAGIIRLLGMAKALDIHFGFCKQCFFFSGVGNSVSVHIAA
ncbi:hypothetical protein G9A89_008422 [Geosiphon pyriformis]|nr:hypothetical protein G9A89_008422 [Geosiphon pyriformis]